VTFGSLFSGIGSLDLGLERAGMVCRWQVENDRACLHVLNNHWPQIRKYEDARQVELSTVERVDLIAGGDPCPTRSRAGSIHGRDKQEDLWPEFLRWVSFLQPLWVLRENVPSPDLDDCAWQLECVGYSTTALELEGAFITAQARRRQFLVGVLATAGHCPTRAFSDCESDMRDRQALLEAGEAVACLTTHPYRMDSRDNYVFEPGRGVRIPARVERERLTGLPDGHTGGVSFRAACRQTGNAVITHKAEWIGRRILAED